MGNEKQTNDYSLLGILDENNNIDSRIAFDKDKVLDKAFGKEYREKHSKQMAFTPSYMANHPLIEELFNTIVNECIKLKTGDIQFAQVNDKLAYIRIKDGVESRVIRIIDPAALTGLIAYIKRIGGMSVDESNVPQDGRITYLDRTNNISWNIRVNIIKDVHNEAVALRLLKADNSEDNIDILGLPDNVLLRLRRVLSQKEGMVLLTGATGSGKPLWEKTLIPIHHSNDSQVSEFKEIKDIEVGDVIFDNYGNLTNVIGVYPQENEEECYKLTFSDGTEIIAGKNHEWITENIHYNNGIEGEYNLLHSDIQFVNISLLSIGIDDMVNITELKNNLSNGAIKLIEDTMNIKDVEEKFLEISALNIIYKWFKMQDDNNNTYKCKPITTEGISKTLKINDEYSHTIKIDNIINFEKEVDLPIHPYILGLWLGSGESSTYLKINSEFLEEIKNLLINYGYNIEETEYENKYKVTYNNGLMLSYGLKELNLLDSLLDDTSVSIPIDYKQSSISERYDIIRGLMDSCGSINTENDYLVFKNKNYDLVKDLKYVLNTLGIQSMILIKKSEDGETDYDLMFTTQGKVFNLKDKNKLHKSNDKINYDNHKRTIISCERVNNLPTVCIEVDSPTHLFLCSESFISTHNTTTMYTSLREIMRITNNQRNIFTIEDPVEYIIPGIVQVSVDEKAGRSYGDGVRALLRQNPDIILIGEIRDEISAKTALRAATSGHLLLSTLHSNGALQVPIVLQRYGVSTHEISSALQMILNQRLEKKLCSKCKQPRMLNSSDLNFLNEIKSKQLVRSYEPNPEGCANCNYTGYDGKVLLVEMLDADTHFDDILNNSKDEYELRQKLEDDKVTSFYSMKKDVVRHIENGNITIETAKDIVRK